MTMTKTLTTAQRLSLTAKTSSSSIHKVKRCLFGRADPAVTRKFLEQQMNHLRKKQSLKWNYDFCRDRPLEKESQSGQIIWQYDTKNKRYIGRDESQPELNLTLPSPVIGKSRKSTNCIIPETMEMPKIKNKTLKQNIGSIENNEIHVCPSKIKTQLAFNFRN